MASLIVYPETEQFRQVVTHVTRHMGYYVSVRSKQLPTLKFTGTIKLHGSNTAIVYKQNVGHWFQSRNRVLTLFYDHADFVQHMDPLSEDFFTEHVLLCCPTIREYYERNSTIVIYGEWCGGNIQGEANVAITGLTKMFVIFKIKIISDQTISDRSETSAQDRYKDNRHGFWLDPKEWANVKWPERSIYNIYDFRTYEIDIDFNNPKIVQSTLTQITEEVERQCPVGTYFNQIGVGEGVVWTEWNQTHGSLIFKVKGREYSVINSKALVPVRTPKLNSIQDFVDYACTKNRMQQAYNCLSEDLRSVEPKDFITFVRWLAEDIIKEEKDTMDTAHIDAKDITRAITSKAQTWFDERIVEDRKVKQRHKKTSK